MSARVCPSFFHGGPLFAKCSAKAAEGVNSSLLASKSSLTWRSDLHVAVQIAIIVIKFRDGVGLDSVNVTISDVFVWNCLITRSCRKEAAKLGEVIFKPTMS